MIEHNKMFVESKAYEEFEADLRPRRKLAILSCMDTRLTELLPFALDIKNGDVHLIKNAGAVIPDPFGTTMRSLLISVHLLGAKEIFVIGHKDCGVQGMDSSKFISKMLSAGVTQSNIDLVEGRGINIKEWLRGFDDVYESVRDTVSMIRGHPLMLASVDVLGFVIDPTTGELEEV
jgi:carbonic anhydrase